MNFDIKKFQDVLYKECKSIFPKILEELSHENIYSFALYNSGDTWGYLFPTVATKKGLSEAVDEYKKKEYYKGKSVDELEAALQWSPCDSPRHEKYVSVLKESEELLRQVDDIMGAFCDSDQEDKCEELHQQLIETCMDVLKKLDSEGFFNTIERSSFVLNILNGDQSDEERLERAKLLNPEQVFKQYESEI